MHGKGPCPPTGLLPGFPLSRLRRRPARVQVAVEALQGCDALLHPARGASVLAAAEADAAEADAAAGLMGAYGPYERCAPGVMPGWEWLAPLPAPAAFASPGAELFLWPADSPPPGALQAAAAWAALKRSMVRRRRGLTAPPRK